MQLALARGHRWLTMLESGEARSLREPGPRTRVFDTPQVQQYLHF